MKVLDLDSIKQYDYMKNSLAFLALGEVEDAVISAFEHIEHDVKDDKARLDISLYIAKIYTKMGEMDASSAILFRLLSLKMEEGRIYALLAYNFYREGDYVSGDLYNAMMKDWNSRHGNILVVDREYERKEKQNKSSFESKHENKIVARAWQIALGGNIQDARNIVGNLDSTAENIYEKCEALLSFDISDGKNHRETDLALDDLFDFDEINIDVMNLIYLFEKSGRYSEMIRLIKEVSNDKISTARLRYACAVALFNVGEKKVALEILEKLTKSFGTVYPYIRVANYFARRNKNIKLCIYDEDENEINLLRDSEICRIVLTSKNYDWLSNRDIIAMVYDMYESGKITDVTGYITSALMRSIEGRKILKEVLLDTNVKTAKMRMYLARNLLEVEGELMLVFENVVNSVKVDDYSKLTASQRSERLDKLAFDLISGN